MSSLLLIALMATLIYLCRLSGFLLKKKTSSFWNTALRFVPLSIFTALVISALYKDSHVLDFKLIALLLAGITAWCTRRFGLSIMVGLGILWTLMRIYS